MTGARLARGRWGEDLAARWYRQHGYHVVMRNWRCAAGEVDIVAARHGMVVFCEVKARSSDAFGGPAAAVGHIKQQRLRRIAATWLADDDHRHTVALHGGALAVRFDVACVLGASIEVIENAF